MRNYVFKPDVVQRIRHLAGVVDQYGNVMPGYMLYPNGCIIDADLAEVTAVGYG